MKKSLSTQELARALGVSASSVRRWVDSGALRSERTAGGHRRVALEEAVRFAREQGLEWRRPAELGAAAVQKGQHGPAALLRALLAGDEPAARGVLEHELLAGRTVAELCDRYVRPAMEEIGRLWLESSHGILVEHRATAICIGALHALAGLLPRNTAPRAMGGAIEGDPYRLPSLMASVVLQAEGFATTDLGPDVPFAVLREAVREHRPKLVWISVGELEEPARLRAELERFLRAESRAGRAVALGGRRLNELELPALPHVHQAGSMAELRALALGLRSAGGTPRRR